MVATEVVADNDASAEPQKPSDEAISVLENAEDGGLKRKVSEEKETTEDGSPKRRKHDNAHEAATEEASRRSRSPSRDRLGEATPSIDQDRRRQAMQEEKKRGKRLFGGLMSTLSQISNTSQQQRRREEIERRQQERVQKQKTEDDQKMTERLERLREVRMAEQIAFDEEVMKHKHAKELAMARFLRTKSEPRIYYLPRKPSPGQDGVIDEQIRDAKAAIAKEVERFKTRKQRHIERYGPPTRRRSTTPDELATTTVTTTTTRGPDRERSAQSLHRDVGKSSEQERRQTQDAHDDQHDESGDVLVEAEEDMVIY